MSNNKIFRIAFFDIFTMGGGVPSVAGRLIRGIQKYQKNIRIYIYDPFGDIKKFLCLSNDENITYLRLYFDDALRELSSLNVFEKISLSFKVIYYAFILLKLNRKHKVDFLVFNLPKSGIIAIISCILGKTKSIFYFHGVQFISDINSFYKILFKLADKIVAVSKGTEKQLKLFRIPQRKITVIYNALDDEWISVKRNGNENKKLNRKNNFIIGYVGNIIRRKGLDVLIKAFIMLKKDPTFEKLELMIIGNDPGEENGNYMKSILSEIKNAGICDSIKFFGYINRPIELMKEFDIFVMPSRMESFGLAIVEAMSLGVPVISTYSGSIPEVIRNGKSGILVPKENAEELAAAIKRLYMDEELRNSLVKEAEKEVKERFNIKNQVEKFYEFLLK